MFLKVNWKFQVWPFIIPILIEIEGQTVPHFKALIYARVELCGLQCGDNLRIETSLLKISGLLHGMGFVWTEIACSVNTYDEWKIMLKFEKFRRAIVTKLTLIYSKPKSALSKFFWDKI